jgi:hypothetical protein
VRIWPYQSTANFSSFSSQRSSDTHGGIYCIILSNPYLSTLCFVFSIHYLFFLYYMHMYTNTFVVLYVFVLHHLQIVFNVGFIWIRLLTCIHDASSIILDSHMVSYRFIDQPHITIWSQCYPLVCTSWIF